MDREKVIKETKDGIAFAESRGFGGLANTMRDAIALLEEQEAVEPRRDANCVRLFRCGACGEYVGFIDLDTGDPNDQDNYCRNCGKAVRWK